MEKPHGISTILPAKDYLSFRLIFATGSILLYVIIFLFLHFVYRFTSMPMLSVFPVSIIAWLYGARIGVIAGVLSLPLNVLLFAIIDINRIKNILESGSGIAGTIGLIFIALIVGRLSDLGQRLRKELSQKQIIEQELQQHRESLEKLVNNKTRELRASEERFRAIAENSPDAIITADPSTTILYCNSAAEKMFGYAPQELIGKSSAVLLSPRLEAKHQMNRDSYIDGGNPGGMGSTIESAVLRKDGTEFPIEFSLFSWELGEQNFFGAIVRDITERKQAENELRQARDFLEHIFKASPEAIIVTDSYGYIIMANESTFNVFGYPPEELIGQHISLFSIDDEKILQKSFAMMEELYEQGFVRNFTAERRRKDGHIIQTEANIVQIKDPDGTPAGIISSSRDITDRKMLEEQLRQSQKMEAIGTLAGGIAHDFNNILAAIMGYTELSKNLAGGNSILEKNLSQVLKSVDRAKALVHQILAFSRKTESVVKPLRLHLVIEEALNLLRASLPSTISIRSDINDTDNIVVADATEIHQIVMNLCTNAAYAMQTTGGVIEVTLKPIDLDMHAAGYYVGIAPGPCVQLSVKDTGMGIPRNVIGRIFEPFFTTKGVGKGTGMGLAMVHGIVKSLKGDITVYSEPGRGSVFHIVLPRAQAENTNGHIAERKAPQGHESVLLVDDEAVLLDVGEQILGSLGYRVTAISSPVEALELFGKNPAAFDIVITDQTMPGLTGYELAQRLMEIRKDVPVILCTGYSDLVTAESASAGGIQAFVMKPLNRLAIAETIRKALDQTAA